VLPSQTKDTRIRIEVLKAIAKNLNSNTNAEADAFVIPHIPRPLLKVNIVRGTNDITSRVYGYTEAIEFHRSCGYTLHDQELIEAYSIAGNMKNLEHKFVILKEARVTMEKRPATDYSRGSKRQKQ